MAGKKRTKGFPHLMLAKLTDKSKEKLLMSLDGGKHNKVHADHVTLAFNPTPEEYKKLVFDSSGEKRMYNGQPVNIHLGTHVYDDVGEAVTARVFSLDGSELESLNSSPHITISIDSSVGPVYSNTLLDTSALHKFEEVPLILDGVITYVE